VNDAVALHVADVGISVESATDVAKGRGRHPAAEEGPRHTRRRRGGGSPRLRHTIKYILMATSSNFGNMFSAAAASAF